MEQALHAELREQNLCFHCGVYNHLRENCYASEKTATLQRKLLHFRENCPQLSVGLWFVFEMWLAGTHGQRLFML
jgi:hypothetical protein